MPLTPLSGSRDKWILRTSQPARDSDSKQQDENKEEDAQPPALAAEQAHTQCASYNMHTCTTHAKGTLGPDIVAQSHICHPST